MRILIVEDEIIFACDLRDRIETLGHEVIGIYDKGEQALKNIERSQPDLVLMDICIRGNMDGIEVTKEVNKFSKVPVVYMTAYNDDSTKQKISNTQYYRLISKPISMIDLEETINELYLRN